MLALQKDSYNDIIYTVFEFAAETSPADFYTLRLESIQNKDSFDSTIFDISTHQGRYNQSSIYVGDSLTTATYSTDTTIAADEVVIVNGNITIATGKTLTVAGILLQYNGTISGTTIISGDGVIQQEATYSNNAYVPSLYVTILNDIDPGYYDYQILQGTTVLETGEVLYDWDESQINKSEYENYNDNKKVYNG